MASYSYKSTVIYRISNNGIHGISDANGTLVDGDAGTVFEEGEVFPSGFTFVGTITYNGEVFVVMRDTTGDAPGDFYHVHSTSD